MASSVEAGALSAPRQMILWEVLRSRLSGLARVPVALCIIVWMSMPTSTAECGPSGCDAALLRPWSQVLCLSVAPPCRRHAMRLVGGAAAQPARWVPDVADLDLLDVPPELAQAPPPPAPAPAPAQGASKAEAELVEMLRGLYKPGSVIPANKWRKLRAHGVRSRHLRAADIFVATQSAERTVAIISAAKVP